MRKVLIILGIIIGAVGFSSAQTVKADSGITGCKTIGCVKCVYDGKYPADACKGTTPNKISDDSKTAG